MSQAAGLEDLEKVRVQYLGRKGAVARLFGEMGSISADERRDLGRTLNLLKQKLETALTERAKALSGSGSGAASSEIDLTLPGLSRRIGHRHPITRTIDEITQIFIRMGFRVVEGPEVETEHYNFTALNIPLDHPARDAFDTFYIEKDTLLRSQTSTVQIRVMEREKPPLRIVAPGRVFRPDAVDASHSFMFHQIEGLLVDEKVSLSELKGVLSVFTQEMFGTKTRMRFRPHHFPFTEPSVEVDIACNLCQGSGCRTCAQKGFLEILGAGMVHPNVFSAVGYDPDRWTGFAFGLGVERIAMLKFGIDDIRLFFENDIRFLHQV